MRSSGHGSFAALTRGYSLREFMPTYVPGCKLWLYSPWNVATIDAAILDGNNMAGAAWSRSNSPATDGETISDTLDGAPTSHYITQPGAPPVTIGAWGEGYCEFKAGTKTWGYFASPNGVIAYLNLATGALGTVTGGSAVVAPLPSGWYGLRTSGYCNSGQAAVIAPANGNGLLSYIGAGTGNIKCRNVSLAQRMVGAWNDLSGNANDYVQALNGDKPVSVASAYAGKPAIRSGDQTVHLEHAAPGGLSYGTQATIFMVHKQGSTLNNYVTCDFAGANGIISRFAGARLEWFNGGGADRFTLANGPVGLHLYSVRQTNGVALQGWRDGASVFGPVVPLAALTNLKSIFARFNGTNGSIGEDICEVIVYDTALSDSAHALVCREVMKRWQI